MEDEAAIAQQQELLAVYRRSLAYYLKQLAQLGEAYAPPGLLHSISEARFHIRAIKASLRQAGIGVEDIFTDEEAPSLAPGLAGERGDEQIAVYQDFWRKLEDLHITIRVDAIDAERFREYMTALNIFALKNSLHISPADQALANEYLEKLYALKALVDTAGSKREKERVAQTGPLTPRQYEPSSAIQELVAQLAQLRDTLYGRVQAIVHPLAAEQRRFCPQCGRQAAPLTKYCGHCGHRY